MTYNFGKLLTRQTNKCEWIFDFGPRLTIAHYAGTDYEVGCNVFRICQFFRKRPPWNQILRAFNDLQLFCKTSPWGCMALAWPLIRPYTRNASPLWLFVLMGHDILFWKAFDVLNKHVIGDFWFWASALIFRLHHWAYEGVKKYLRIGQFFIS